MKTHACRRCNHIKYAPNFLKSREAIFGRAPPLYKKIVMILLISSLFILIFPLNESWHVIIWGICKYILNRIINFKFDDLIDVYILRKGYTKLKSFFKRK